MDSSFLLDQIVLIFGSTRFNGKEMHAINVPYPFSKNRRVLRSHRTEEMNGTLRKILEADVFCNFPPSDITSAHLFLHGCPVDMDSNLLQFFEPLMRFTPKVGTFQVNRLAKIVLQRIPEMLNPFLVVASCLRFGVESILAYKNKYFLYRWLLNTTEAYSI